MSGIVCAIRGGPASRPTIDVAIRTADETKLPLYFLYVVNVDFLMHTARTRTQTIIKELTELGEFILLVARTQAEAQGVSAQGLVYEGDVREEIINLCQEITANYVVLGRPQTVEEDVDVFTHDLLSQFGRHIEEKTGAIAIFPERDINEIA